MAAAELNPQSPGPHDALAGAYWMERKVPEAFEEVRKARLLDVSTKRLHIQKEVGAVYAKSGYEAASRPWAELEEPLYSGDDEEAYDICAHFVISSAKDR